MELQAAMQAEVDHAEARRLLAQEQYDLIVARGPREEDVSRMMQLQALLDAQILQTQEAIQEREVQTLITV